MSNPLATVQEIYQAFGRGDIATILDSLASEVVWEIEGPASVSFTGVRHGVSGAAEFFLAIRKDHANPKLTIDEYIASGDTVAPFGRYQATMKATGKVADTPIAHYWKVRDNKVVRYVGFINSGAFEEALKA